MPQMAPLSWLTLLFYFISIFICLNCLNYFSFMYSVKKQEILKSALMYNWKW